ncbi:hypothetical protein EV426DRAFT_702605 [Tirmania nivea]|nr:hypothetical protein EV426DRAFT_702605 [Tirmania nivea]
MRRQQVKGSTSKAKPEYIKKAKLRPAHGIINRMKWDSDMDIHDYIIVYEERFLGILQIKGDETDERWVLLHRVAWIKRAIDGVVVWHRKKWTDIIFGTGDGTIRSSGQIEITKVKIEDAKGAIVIKRVKRGELQMEWGGLKMHSTSCAPPKLFTRLQTTQLASDIDDWKDKTYKALDYLMESWEDELQLRIEQQLQPELEIKKDIFEKA